MKTTAEPRRQYLLASDFDQTLSFNDSGVILSDMLGANDFIRKVEGLASINLVQQGGELAYLLLHDPEYRHVRRHHLVEAGKRVPLKPNIDLLYQLLGEAIPGYAFELFVVSAAPVEVVQSALEGLVPADHIFGTEFQYDPDSGEIQSIRRVPAGYGKVAVLDRLQAEHRIPYDRVVYVGDGSSDIHVMLHVNHRNGLTIAVSEARRVSQIAKRTVLSGDALSILVPILEDVVGCGPEQVRGVLQSRGLVIQEWEKGRTDWLNIQRSSQPVADEPGVGA